MIDTRRWVPTPSSSYSQPIRTRERGRYGVLALDRAERPRSGEMMADKLVLRVSGAIRWHGLDVTADDAAALLHRYGDLLARRPETPQGRWRVPTQGKASFNSALQPSCTTITGARLEAKWNRDEVKLGLSLKLNPTRTLIQLLPRMTAAADPIAALRQMPTDLFFSTSEDAVAGAALDDGGNAIDRFDEVIDLLGPDYPSLFIEIFEEHARRWAIEAVAPLTLGFAHDLTTPDPRAEMDDQSITLEWTRLVVSSIELYCERRYHDAVGLMNRVAAHVHAAHSSADWHSYDVEQDLGGRLARSMSVGIKLTEDIHQICYAKTSSRVRIEVRYLRKVRASLRLPASISLRPLAYLFGLLQPGAAARIKWDSFCNMCLEPPHAMLAEVGGMMALIAECARQARVPAKPVFTALLTERSIAEDDGEHFPRRLMKKLEAVGLIDRQSLMRRVRPGQRRRHRLTPLYFEMAGRLQDAFAQHQPAAAVAET